MDGEFWTDGLHVLVLWSFAVADPVLQIVGDEPSRLIAMGFDVFDLLLLLAGLFFPVPALLILAEGGLRRIGRESQKTFHFAVLSVLTALVVLPPLKANLPASGWLAVLLSFLAAAIFAWSAHRLAPVRIFLTGLSPALLIFPAVFLFSPPVTEITYARWTPPMVKPGGIRAPAPIVMVVFDELPLYSLLDDAGAIDAVRFPYFSALAKGSSWFPNTYTVSDFTRHAVPAILTGLRPHESKLPGFNSYPDNLFSWLSQAYELVVMESDTRLCPPPYCDAISPASSRLRRGMRLLIRILPGTFAARVLPADVRTGLDAFAHRLRRTRAGSISAESPPRNIARRFDDFIRTIRPYNRPVLYFLHPIFPHAPFNYLPSGKYVEFDSREISQDPIYSKPTTAADGRALLSLKYQRHLLQVAYADRLLGRILRRLKETGLYDSALIVVTADHGAAFNPVGDMRKVTAGNAIEVLKVPFFMKSPNQKSGEIRPRRIQTTDILPTIADVLGSKLTWLPDGASAMRPGFKERDAAWVLCASRPKGYRVAEFPIQKTLEAKLLARKRTLIDPKNDWFSWNSPWNALIGRQISRLQEITPVSGAEVQIFNPDRYTRVDIRSKFIPAILQGTLRTQSPQKNPLTLAIALNGSIQTIARTFFHRDNESRFMAALPERAFQNGNNVVEVFSIRSENGRPVLERLK